MKSNKKQRGYLLLQCAIALFCVSIGLALLLKMHVGSLRAQKYVQSSAWALLHAGSARHIQHFYTHDAQYAWQQQLEASLPSPSTQIAWRSEGPMRICWESSQCWQLE